MWERARSSPIDHLPPFGVKETLIDNFPRTSDGDSSKSLSARRFQGLRSGSYQDPDGAPSSFYDRFNAGLVRFLKAALARGLENFQLGWGVVDGLGSAFRDFVLADATLTVDLNGGADETDIQSAIDAAKDGDTVLVKPGAVGS